MVSYGYILSGRTFNKNAKNGPFENLTLAVKECYQTGHFWMDKIDGKCHNWKIKTRHFWRFSNTVIDPILDVYHVIGASKTDCKLTKCTILAIVQEFHFTAMDFSIIKDKNNGTFKSDLKSSIFKRELLALLHLSFTLFSPFSKSFNRSHLIVLFPWFTLVIIWLHIFWPQLTVTVHFDLSWPWQYILTPNDLGNIFSHQ